MQRVFNTFASMEIQILYSLKFTSFFVLLVLLGATPSSSKNNTKCPFDYFFHFGDGFSDTGNSIRVLPQGPSLPATRLPYGKTYPGRPNGRWSDGLIHSDYLVDSFGFPNVKPYLASDNSSNLDGVIVSVTGSPVLDRSFFTSKGVNVPSYVASMKQQLQWFKAYLNAACSNETDCPKRILQNSIIVFGDVEGNDLGYPLSQGKSIEEVKGYVPFVINETIAAARELLTMGATRLAIPTNIPVGCYPYMLTALRNSSTFLDYDLQGCLRRVNGLTLSKNKDLQLAVNKLILEFPRAKILFADLYGIVKTIISTTSISGVNPLKPCCGVGGKYNFDPNRFCGSPGVPSCPDPNRYVYWDGIHFTQEASKRLERIDSTPALPFFGCSLL